MKITLTEAQTIKSRDFDEGDEVIVNKELGERMIEEGLANRIIEEPENRTVEVPENVSTTDGKMTFTGHRRRRLRAGYGYLSSRTKK